MSKKFGKLASASSGPAVVHDSDSDSSSKDSSGEGDESDESETASSADLPECNITDCLDETSFITSLLGMSASASADKLPKSKAKGKVAPARSPTKPSAASPAPSKAPGSGKRSPAMKTTRVQSSPSQPSVANDSEDAIAPTRGKGRGKGAIIPSDPEEILRRDGFYQVKETFDALMKSLAESPFDKSLLVVADKTAFFSHTKQIAKDLACIQKELIRIDTLVQRRTNSPDDVKSQVKSFRAKVRNLMQLLNDVGQQGKIVQSDQMNSIIVTLEADGHGFGIAIKICCLRARCAELVHFGKFDDVGTLLDMNNGFLAKGAKFENSVIREVHDGIAESSLLQVLNNIKGKKAEADAEIIAHAKNLCALLEASVTTEMSTALSACAQLMRLEAEDVDAKEQTEILELFEQHAKDPNFSGLEKTMVQLPCWVTLSTAIRNAVAEKEKQAGSFCQIVAATRHLAELSNHEHTPPLGKFDSSPLCCSIDSVLRFLQGCSPSDKLVVKFMAFFSSHNQAMEVMLQGMLAELGKAVEDLCAQDNDSIIAHVASEGSKRKHAKLADLEQRIFASGLDSKLDAMKPHSFQTNDLVVLIQEYTKTKTHASLLVKLATSFVTAATTFGHVLASNTPSMSFFEATHEMSKLIEEAAPSSSRIKGWGAAVSARFNAQDIGMQQLQTVHEPAIQARQ